MVNVLASNMPQLDPWEENQKRYRTETKASGAESVNSEGGQEDPLSDEPVNSDLESCFKSAGPGQNIQMRQTQNNQLWRTP
ncbi:uncharacterized protein PHA67_022868 isoform 2-T3 [Liasis olivaceus]